MKDKSQTEDTLQLQNKGSPLLECQGEWEAEAEKCLKQHYWTDRRKPEPQMSNCYTDQALQTSDLGNYPMNTLNIVRVKWNAVKMLQVVWGQLGKGQGKDWLGK